MESALFALALVLTLSSIALVKGGQQQCTYEFSVFTGDRPGAGTDADVYMRLQSQNGVSLNFQLDRPGNIFEQSGVDRFVSTNECVGRICKVEVTQNGKYPSSSWYVKGVKIVVKQGNKCVSGESFTINEWVKDPVLERSGNSYRMKYHWVPANNCGKSPSMSC